MKLLLIFIICLSLLREYCNCCKCYECSNSYSNLDLYDNHRTYECFIRTRDKETTSCLNKKCYATVKLVLNPEWNQLNQYIIRAKTISMKKGCADSFKTTKCSGTKERGIVTRTCTEYCSSSLCNTQGIFKYFFNKFRKDFFTTCRVCTTSPSKKLNFKHSCLKKGSGILIHCAGSCYSAVIFSGLKYMHFRRGCLQFRFKTNFDQRIKYKPLVNTAGNIYLPTIFGHGRFGFCKPVYGEICNSFRIISSQSTIDGLNKNKEILKKNWQNRKQNMCLICHSRRKRKSPPTECELGSVEDVYGMVECHHMCTIHVFFYNDTVEHVRSCSVLDNRLASFDIKNSVYQELPPDRGYQMDCRGCELDYEEYETSFQNDYATKSQFSYNSHTECAIQCNSKSRSVCVGYVFDKYDNTCSFLRKHGSIRYSKVKVLYKRKNSQYTGKCVPYCVKSCHAARKVCNKEDVSNMEKDILMYMEFRQIIKKKITQYPNLNMFRFIKQYGTYLLSDIDTLHTIDPDIELMKHRENSVYLQFISKDINYFDNFVNNKNKTERPKIDKTPRKRTPIEKQKNNDIKIKTELLREPKIKPKKFKGDKTMKKINNDFVTDKEIDLLSNSKYTMIVTGVLMVVAYIYVNGQSRTSGSGEDMSVKEEPVKTDQNNSILVDSIVADDYRRSSILQGSSIVAYSSGLEIDTTK